MLDEKVAICIFRTKKHLWPNTPGRDPLISHRAGGSKGMMVENLSFIAVVNLFIPTGTKRSNIFTLFKYFQAPSVQLSKRQ